MRSDRERLLDIQESIEKIERYTAQGKNTFFEEELIQTWVLYHLQIIGEASRSMSQGLRDRYSEVPWERVIGFRNLAVHEYFRVDLELVWEIVTKNLPSLQIQVDVILKTES